MRTSVHPRPRVGAFALALASGPCSLTVEPTFTPACRRARAPVLVPRLPRRARRAGRPRPRRPRGGVDRGPCAPPRGVGRRRARARVRRARPDRRRRLRRRGRRNRARGGARGTVDDGSRPPRSPPQPASWSASAGPSGCSPPGPRPAGPTGAGRQHPCWLPSARRPPGTTTRSGCSTATAGGRTPWASCRPRATPGHGLPAPLDARLGRPRDRRHLARAGGRRRRPLPAQPGPGGSCPPGPAPVVRGRG